MIEIITKARTSGDSRTETLGELAWHLRNQRNELARTLDRIGSIHRVCCERAETTEKRKNPIVCAHILAREVLENITRRKEQKK